MFNQKFSIGDKVMIVRTSARTMNLYEKVKSKGYSYIKCPCSCKNTDILEVENFLMSGYILRNKVGRFLTIIDQQDLRKII